MRLKVPFLGYVLAIVGLLLPSTVFVALLPSFIDTQPVKERLLAELNEWTGGEVSNAGAVSIDSLFSVSIEVRDVEINKLKALPTINGIQAQKIVASISALDLLFGNLNFNKIRIYNAVIKVEAKDAREAANSLFAMLSGPRANPFATFIVSDSLVAMRESPGKPYRRLHVDSATVRVLKSDGEIAARGRLRWAGEPVAFSVRKGIAAADRPETRALLKVQLDGAMLSGTFDGEAAFAGAWDMVGSFGLRTSNVARLGAWLGLNQQQLTSESLDVRASLDMRDEVSLRSVEVTLGGQSASGNLDLKLGGAVPHLQGGLAFANLDLDRLFAEGQGPAVAARALSLLTDVDLRISANSMSWQGVKTGAAAFTLTAKPGHVAAEIAELEFVEGSVRGHVGVDLSGENARAQLRLSAENLNAAALLDIGRQRDWLSGRADANIEADVQWSAAGEFLQASTAHARVTFPEGGQIRLNIPHLAETAAAGAITGWDGVDFARVDFDELRVMLTLKNGQLHCDNLDLAGSGEFVSGAGVIDLPGQSVDMRFVVMPGSGRPEQYSSLETAPAKGAARSNISIQGALAHPVIRATPASHAAATVNAKSAAALEVLSSQR